MNFWVLLMPVGVLLESSRGLDDADVVAGSCHKLQTNWKILVVESTGNGDCRETADIADAAQWIRKNKVGFRSEEHTSELQSRPHLVCRLLLDKIKRGWNR